MESIGAYEEHGDKVKVNLGSVQICLSKYFKSDFNVVIHTVQDILQWNLFQIKATFLTFIKLIKFIII